MITKGIIEELISPYEVKVRIPTLDRVTTSSLATSTENLNIATICTLPNCYINLQVGDVVFVGFEDNTYYKAVILGHLSREAAQPYVDITVGNFIAKTSVTLPRATTIGTISSEELQSLKGAKDNLQNQIDNILERLEIIKEYINNKSDKEEDNNDNSQEDNPTTGDESLEDDQLTDNNEESTEETNKE